MTLLAKNGGYAGGEDVIMQWKELKLAPSLSLTKLMSRTYSGVMHMLEDRLGYVRYHFDHKTATKLLTVREMDPCTRHSDHGGYSLRPIKHSIHGSHPRSTPTSHRYSTGTSTTADIQLVPEKGWLGTKDPRRTLISHSGNLSMSDRAGIANWFETHVALRKNRRIHWLGLLPLAHALTLFIASQLV